VKKLEMPYLNMKYIRCIIFYLMATIFFTILISFLPVRNSDVRFSSQSVTTIVKGTSTLHDWEMKSDKGKTEMMIKLGKNDIIIGISALTFTMEAQSLKSGKSGMDKDAYKALKTRSSKNIGFVLSSAQVSSLTSNSYQVKAIGKLSIAGNTRETDIVASVKYNAADKSFIVTGSKKIKMTSFNVKPPSSMWGAVKSGDDITISFQTKVAR
jgi:hypothetical protein